MQLHSIQPKTKNKKRMQVGRGGKRGKTSGRGTKGQLARSGHKLRPELRDIIKKLPKRRGRGKNIFQSFEKRPISLNIGNIDKAFEPGTVITPALLLERGLIRAPKGPRLVVKILGTGEVTKKFTINGCLISSGAQEKIEKAGGKIS